VAGIRTRPGRPHLLVSRHRNPGRRRAPGAVRRLPDGFTRLGATWATKSIAAIGVLGGAAVALALPVDASPAALTLATPVATSSVGRTDGLAASRASVRSAAPALALPAVSAPEGAAPLAPEQVGVAGVKAVAKPKPKPKPKPVAKATSSGSDSAEAPSSSYSTSISGQCGSIGLNNDAARLCSAVDSIFHLGSIGGYRANAGEHSTGQAVDFMISSRSQGDSIAAWVQSHVGEFNVQYVIWRQRYWEPGSSWDPMEDRGSPTANHYDHVHVTVN
jgi:hypothetical protein